MNVTDGFGICGHKNWYSSNVRCGNWVEDTIGAELGEAKQHVSLSSTSEAREKFRDPSTRRTSTDGGNQEHAMKGSEASSRDLPKSILMNHRGDGQIHLPWNDEQAKETVYGSIFGRASRDEPGSHIRQRQLRMLGLSESNPYESSSHSSQQDPFRAQATVHTGKSEGHRRVPDMSFSKSFVHKFQGGWKLRAGDSAPSKARAATGASK